MEYGEKHYYTLEEFEKMQNSNECKIEYFNGEIILHPKTSFRYNEIVLNIATCLKSYFRQSKYNVYREKIEVLFHNQVDTINVFPDVFVICKESIIKGESFASTPKIIFEVASENCGGNEYIKKLKLYQKYGVQEYVIVHQTGEMIQYFLEDGLFKATDNAYYKSKIFNDLEIKLEDIFE